MIINLKYLKRLLSLRILKNKYPYYSHVLASSAYVSVEEKCKQYPVWMAEYFNNDCSNYMWTMFLSQK